VQKVSLGIPTVLSTLNDEIIKHDLCTLQNENENMFGYSHTLVHLVQLLSHFIVKKIRGLK